MVKGGTFFNGPFSYMKGLHPYAVGLPNMPDVLLLQPPIRDFYLTAKRSAPYGLACIAAALQQTGFTVEILDALATSRSRTLGLPPEMNYLEAFYGLPDRSPFGLFHHYRHFGRSFAHIARQAQCSKAFLVGISSLFTAYEKEAVKTAETVKAALPQCKTVLGGHHPTELPEYVMQSSAVDFVLRGDGEIAMPMLAKALSKGTSLAHIPGLVRRGPNSNLIISAPARIKTPDDFPLPARQLIDQSYYRRGKKATMVVVTSRGCPMKCSYCCMRSSADHPYVRRSVNSVLAEIGQAESEDSALFVDFEDENLSLDRRWFLSLLKNIQNRFGSAKLELRAMNGLFPPSLDEEIVRAMAGAGFTALNLSLGSTAEAQLQKFRRPDVRKAFDRALALAGKYGLAAVGYIIAGAPDQMAMDSLEDLLFLAARRVLAGVSIYYPVPGTPDFQRCNDLGVLPAKTTLMRSSAFPVDQTTSREEAVTILRLARVTNFMKSLLDRGENIPAARTDRLGATCNVRDRNALGKLLLARFLNDGIIRGATDNGEIYEHRISDRLTRMFLQRLKTTVLRGTV